MKPPPSQNQSGARVRNIPSDGNVNGHSTPGRRNIALALAVAIGADTIQLPLTLAMSAGVTIPFLEAADIIIDVAAMLIIVRLIGFHWLLLPGFVLEAIPLLGAIPTWTGCVAYLVWKRQHDAAKPAPHSAATILPGSESPPAMGTLESQGQPPLELNPPQRGLGNSTVLRLAALAAVVLGVLSIVLIGMFFRKPSEVRAATRPSPAPPSQVSSAPPKTAPTRTPHQRPTLAVAPVGIEASAYTPVDANGRSAKGIGKKERAIRNAEFIYTLLEDHIAQIDNLDLLPRPSSKEDSLAEQPDFVLTATLLSLQDELGQFHGYGIQANAVETECTMKLRLIRTADQSILFSKTSTGLASEYRTAVARGPSNSDRDLQAIESALSAFDKDGALTAAILSLNPQSSR